MPNPTSLSQRVLLLAWISAFSIACAPGKDAAESAPVPGNAIDCQAGEDLVFAGEVQDDFGLSINVCLKPSQAEPLVSIHYSGEGGTRTVACKPSQCSGTIDFSHYVRPRFSILTLTWRDENGVQRIVETFDAQLLDSEPLHHVSHSWTPFEPQGAAAQPQSYPVTPQTNTLSLLRLDQLLAT